jgi:hypothetical protein
MAKDKLTPMEKMQEASITEVLNKQSLNQLQELECEKKREFIKPVDGPLIKYIQDI